MNITAHAKTRYSTKAFDSTKRISDQHIAEIKELIRFSPSSTNAQPWHFILASSDEAKQKVAQATQGFYSFNEGKILNASHVLVFCAKTSIDENYLLDLLEVEDQDGRFSNDEAKQGQHRGRSYFVNMHRFDLKDAQHWMEKQVYLNVGTVLLGVSTLGIDAVPIEGFDAKVLDEAFALREQGLSSVVIVPLGYRSEEDFNAKLPKSRWPETTIITEC
ncbi:oxygen-insensitive NAD(P)H-dependent nitroreductase NfsB [Vibrio aestuarianus]|uniref:NAD(P)H nitroreductase NfsB n=1 Tax=Vibrio aestuarianus TaxID=28171 RepID=A0A7X6N8Q5_9VIBR|nr:oxygen-insensitive NAD(P)H-dependent nitroreductase NfsB [Vibrio aestuarianus]KOE82536.1 dihydropteridine reductase [Vibrio alginolyticus]MDE1209041.1 oxygen-insensitive NAD(P)H-dependent nitroreductase NfsB [Vibrio aestuarianus]MDE1228283.1 oxygen-insensitive NAD(P)H-dependent nitroreductase NfsB [Vibrio aestuarianus]MDE1232833.1 oxygen-insensitive NAD(P)H-dependent nitroreductase NfsB [Vibrio aestuarianus]MDE1235383.1 oxygen-insensitive NAD(P)H-dependent nitroreductase NfsB [Vibrio aestua